MGWEAGASGATAVRSILAAKRMPDKIILEFFIMGSVADRR
jgi:hypothetical protein